MWGQILLGFGMLFFGLKLMETAFQPLRDRPEFMPFFAQFGADTLGQILKSVLAGFLMTIIIQSSSATVGIAIALANQGLLTYPGAAALVLGDNIGTTITMELAAIGTNVMARRAARVHSMFNIIGVAYMVLLFPWYIRLVDWIAPGPMDFVAPDGTKPFIAAHIAAGHSIFNIFNTVVLLPCAGLLVKIAGVMVPGDRRQLDQHLEFIDIGLVAVPYLAIEQAKKELLRMCQRVKEMFTWSEKLLFEENFDRELSKQLFKFENIIDSVQTEISKFLTHLLQSAPGPEVTEDARRYLRVADEFESIGDCCERIAKYAVRKEQQHITFSYEATAGLRSLYSELLEYLELCTLCFIQQRTKILHEVDSKSQSLRETIEQLRSAHEARLNRNECRVIPGLLYTDILTALQNVRAHAHNAAEASLGLK
jgi:phosphate:Na+ symporter